MASLLLAVSACTSSSTASDLDTVRALSGARSLPSPYDAGGERAADEEDARKLLAAPLDAEGAVRIALMRNRELRASLDELGVARGRLMQAGVVANPVVSAEAVPADPTQVDLRLEYEISSLLLASKRADAAEAELDAARYRAAAAVVRFAYEVRAAFLAVQASERRLAIAAQALEAFALGRDAATALLEAGNIRELDVASQIAAHERARVRLAEIDLELSERRERLQRLLGIDARDAGDAIQVQAGPQAAPAELELPKDIEQHVEIHSLELAEVRSRGAAAAELAGASRTEGWLPDLTLAAIGTYEDRLPEERAEGEKPWRAGAGISLSLPLFDREQGTVRSHEAEHARQVDLGDALRLELRSRAREAERRVVSAHGRAKKLETVVLPAQHSVLDQTLLQYNAMQVSVFQVLAARRDELEVELAYVETLREYWTASAALEALLAGVRVAQDAASATLALPMSEQGGH
jgi:outer membrane protein TolC